MKNFTLAFACFGIFFSCSEIPPGQNIGGPSNPDKVFKKVLIEEFTGVRCQGCPAGAESIQRIIDIHGDKIVAVGIHATTQFARPYDESRYDFRTEEGEMLLSFLQVNAFPRAVLNRKVFPDENKLELPKESWAGYSEQELREEAAAKINLTTDYDSQNRKVDINVEIEMIKEVEIESPRISVYVTENNIIDYQLNETVLVSDYLHKHVFRTALSSFSGDLITEDLGIGTKINRSFEFTVESEWKEQDISVIAFIHNGAEVKEVLQVEEVHILN